jgi:hypothetical protein
LEPNHAAEPQSDATNFDTISTTIDDASTKYIQNELQANGTTT